MRIKKIQEFQEIQKEDKKKERKKSGLLTFRVVWVTLKVTTAGDVFHPILHKVNKTLSKTLTEIKSTPSPRHHSPCTPPPLRHHSPCINMYEFITACSLVELKWFIQAKTNSCSSHDRDLVQKKILCKPIDNSVCRFLRKFTCLWTTCSANLEAKYDFPSPCCPHRTIHLCSSSCST